MRGLDPRIHHSSKDFIETDGLPGHRRAEATPSFGRLCPAMTSVPSLLLLRPLIGDAPDDGGLAEFLAQIVDRALGVRGAAIEHVGIMGLRTRAERADACAHQPESGAVDF